MLSLNVIILKCDCIVCQLFHVKLLKIQFKVCEDCGGSGICPACRGEGFVLRKRSDESAEKARNLAKNMATRFTAGYNYLISLFL